MSFIADKQTLDDLNVLGKHKPNTMYSLFNRVTSRGGERLLDAAFRHPLTDPQEINRRSAIIRYFHQRALEFPVGAAVLDAAERYLKDGAAPNGLLALATVARMKLMKAVTRSEHYDLMVSGLKAFVELLTSVRGFLRGFEKADYPYQAEIGQIRQLLADARLQPLLHEAGQPNWSMYTIARYNQLIKRTLHRPFERLLEILYELDLYIAVSGVARERDFGYADAMPATANQLAATQIRHPAIAKAVANDLGLDGESNVLFLTGANMAGKSTLMKTIGINLYLAHMGFPVAAKSLAFSVRDGIYSSINVPDNLDMGYSHFYAEVLRVKQVAEEVSASKNLLVIFDELFKGTNVKDAYDATLAVTGAFADYRNCLFVISTHIIEVGEALQAKCRNLQFRYLPTVMDGVSPRYTYRLTEGITSDRQGMMIIRNEQILEIISGVPND